MGDRSLGNHIIIGNYGSGKTEVAVNYAFALKETHPVVSIVDLDIVNPYFRCREARETLRQHGIEVIVPDNKYMHADLPIIVPEIKGAIEKHTGQTIFDVGGDDAGARVLRGFREIFATATYDLIMVINANRPFTDSVAGVIRIMHEIEIASGLKVTALISNTHLINETRADTIYQGYDLARQVSLTTGLPIKFVTVLDRLLDSIDPTRFDVPLFPIVRRMIHPWEIRSTGLPGPDALKPKKFTLEFR
jgi:hypothetical protein